MTGRGFHAVAPCCSQSAMSAFSQPVSTTLPSTPAVLRPALSSVTRRTLSRAFDRERSISFCKLRTFFRSPSCDAVKIRCRSRRTSSSTRRQSTCVPVQHAALRSVHLRTASNLPIGSGVSAHPIITGSPDPRQRPFGPGTSPYPASYPGPPAEMPARGPGFLLPFGHRPSLLGSSFARWGIQPPSRSAHRRDTAAGPQRGCRVAHEQDATGQGAPFTPGTVVRSRPATILRPAPAAFQRPVPTAPLEHPTRGGNLHETSSGVHSRSPITPRQRPPPRGREARRLPPVFSGEPRAFRTADLQ